MSTCSQQLESIRKICRVRRLDENDTFVITKKLLESYRGALWLRGGSRGGGDLEGSLLFCEEGVRQIKQWYVNLRELTKEELKAASIDSMIFHVCRTEWIFGVFDSVMKKIGEYYEYGRVYYDILTRAYLSEDRPTDAVVAEELAMDRSTFYRRKKEAILLCGILLWEEVRERKFA